jgi:hypothetical protein
MLHIRMLSDAVIMLSSACLTVIDRYVNTPERWTKNDE